MSERPFCSVHQRYLSREDGKCYDCRRIEQETDVLHATIASLESQLAAAQAKLAELTDRLLERANEEPPSGWLRQGEDGYENTPQGARDKRDEAVAALAAAQAREKRLDESLRGLLGNIQTHHDKACPGITPADCLDAIYESAEIARSALSRDGKEGA